jgi:hypothetical protein
MFMGNNYYDINSLLHKIKQHMPHGNNFTMNLKSEPKQKISNSCQLCLLLMEIAFINRYKYKKSPACILDVSTSVNPKAQNFLSGKWLEIYVMMTVRKIVNEISANRKNIKFSYLMNPQISLPNGADFELDFLFEICDTIYWIEAKSGNYQQHIHKYSKVSRILNLDIDHSIMVITDSTNEKSESLKKIFDISVCDISSFPSMINKLINKDLNILPNQ